MKCIILENNEITDEECMNIRYEAGRDKKDNDKGELPKKVKRIIGWKGICKTCRFYSEIGEMPKKRRK